MASTSTTLIHAVKLLLMSTGAVFIAVLLTPQIFNLTAAQLPSIWISFRSWLRPPYLYVIINGIIITIAASSRLHHHYTHPPPAAADSDEFRHVDNFRASETVSIEAYNFAEPKAPINLSVPAPLPIPPLADFNLFYAGEVLDQNRGAVIEENRGAVTEAETATFGAEEIATCESAEQRVEEVEEVKAITVIDRVPEKPRNYDLASVDDGSAEPAPLARQETVDIVSSFFQSQIEKPLLAQNQRSSRSALSSLAETEEKVVNYKIAPTQPPLAPLARQETSEIVSSFFQSQIEKPPPSARFGQNRRPTKSTNEGKALRVAKPKRNETLEGTWKTITEGRHMPLTRHLKKSDTWENQSRPSDSSDPSTPSVVKKSDTFSDRTNYTATTMAAKLKKDPSLSQDELNRRVEAFINKVNEDMKLQRQQSMQQFLEMINRAK